MKVLLYIFFKYRNDPKHLNSSVCRVFLSSKRPQLIVLRREDETSKGLKDGSYHESPIHPLTEQTKPFLTICLDKNSVCKE